jgi:hypothetical protein|tara:strand:- start:2249 stop:3775 length:1527 start_codon:yes stop_codon:yes gene_type:complete
MKRILGYYRLMAPADEGGEGGGGASEQHPETKIPTAEEVVAHRRQMIAQKEAEAEEARKNRFKKKDDEIPPKKEEEEEKEDEEEEEEEDTSPPKKKAKKKEAAEEEEGEDDDDDLDLFDDDEDEEEEEDDDDEEEDDDSDDEDSEDDNDEEGSEDEHKTIKALRKKTKEEGRGRKKAEAEVVSLQTENDRLTEELEAEKKKNKNLASQNINWGAHEDVASLWDEFDKAVFSGAQSFSDPETAKQFAEDAQKQLLSEYFNLTKDVKNINDRIDKNAQFKATLEERYGITDASSVVTSVSRALDAYQKVESKVEELKSMHENNSLALGVNEYQSAVSQYSDHIEQLGNVDEEFMETDPDAVESIVGKKFQTDDKFKIKANKFKKRAIQYIFGLRPLTQDELKKAEAHASSKGMTLDQYIKRRQENYEKGRLKFINDVFYNEMIMDNFGEYYADHKKVVKARDKNRTAKKAIKKKKVSTTSSKKPDKKVTKDKLYPGHKDWVPVTQRFPRK